MECAFASKIEVKTFFVLIVFDSEQSSPQPKAGVMVWRSMTLRKQLKLPKEISEQVLASILMTSSAIGRVCNHSDVCKLILSNRRFLAHWMKFAPTFADRLLIYTKVWPPRARILFRHFRYFFPAFIFFRPLCGKKTIHTLETSSGLKFDLPLAHSFRGLTVDVCGWLIW